MTARRAATAAPQHVRGPLAHLRRDWAARIGLAILLTLTVLTLAAPALAPYDPTETEPADRLQGPSRAHLLGTDQLGRDVLSRLLWGGRTSLGTVTLAALVTMTIGVGLGALAGYFGGWVDSVLMRLADVLLALPGLVLALAVVGALGPSVRNVVLALVAVWWVSYARVTRSLVLSVREREYVTAARALGASHTRLLARHVMPNVLPPVVVLVTLEMGRLLLAIAGLNFLGLGAQPPDPEWGAMLNDGRTLIQRAPQLMLYPGLAITITALAFNLLGDGLRDALDPHLGR